MTELNLFFDLPLEIQLLILDINENEHIQYNKQKFNSVIKSFNLLKDTWNDCFIITEDYDYIIRPQYIDNNELFTENTRNSISSFLISNIFFEIHEFY